ERALLPDLERFAAQRLERLVERPRRVAGLAAGEEDRELLAAPPGDEIGGPKGLRDDAGDATEDLVPRRAAARLVHQPEVVDVDHRDRQRFARHGGDVAR